MRRFWAHITLILTALLLMGTTFFSIFTKVGMNLEYTEGSEVTYRITDRYDEATPIDTDEGVKAIATEMATRLDNTGVTDYNIRTVGNDIIKVQFAEPNNLNRNNITSYLRFNGSLALSNMDDDENYLHITADEFLLKDQKAYLDSINSYPTIVIPVDTASSAYQDLIEKTKSQAEAGVGETTETDETDENGEKKTTTTTYLYMWYDFDEENDRYSKTVSSSEDYDVNVAQKIIMKFNIDELYYPDGEENKLAASLNMDSDGSGSITQTEVRDSYNNARFYINLLNADTLDYKVTAISDQQIKFIPATTESLIINSDPHQYLALSRTLIATIIALAITSAICVVFFKISTPSIIVTTLLSIFASIGLITVMNAEFNIGAIIALTAIACVSLAANILYAGRLKEEIYKGRTLKKANSEAARRSLLPTVDIHVVLILIGIFTYIFGGSLMRTFALVSVAGGLASLLINLIIYRILMWLITNNTAFNQKFTLFGVRGDKLLVKEEEEKAIPYKGAFVSTNFSKHSKLGFIGSIVLCVASLAGLITFGILGNNQPFNTTSNKYHSELFVYTTNEIATTESLERTLLNEVVVYESDADTTGKALKEYVVKTENYTHSEMVNGVQKDTYYFEYELSSDLNEDTLAIATYVPGSQKQKLVDALNEYNGIDEKSVASVKVSTVNSKNKANFAGIALGSGVALLVTGLYFVLRYKLSRGLTGFILTAVTSIIGFGIFSLARIPFPTTASVTLPFIVLFGAIISIFIMSKEKELVADDKARTIDYARRDEIMKEAVGISFNEILAFGGIALYIIVNFAAFGPVEPSLLYIILLVASLLAIILSLNLFAPIAKKLYENFSPVENRKHKKKRKSNKDIVSATHKSSEPEEAVFIGIND